MNKCEKCGFLHYRTDPCRKSKKSTAARSGRAGSNKAEEGMTQLPPLAGTQALPVDTNSRLAENGVLMLSTPQAELTSTSAGTVGNEDRQLNIPPKPRSANRHRPGYFTEYMRDYRKGILRRPKPSDN